MKTFGKVAEFDMLYFVTHNRKCCEFRVEPLLVNEITEEILPGKNPYSVFDCGKDNIKCYVGKPQLGETNVVYETDVWVFADDDEAVKFAKELKNKEIETLKKLTKKMSDSIEKYERNNIIFG